MTIAQGVGIIGLFAVFWISGFLLGRETERGKPELHHRGTEEWREEFGRVITLWLSCLSDDHSARTSRAIGQATRVIMAKLATLERTMDVKLDDLLDAVASQQTKIDSLITLSNELHARVLEAMGDTITPSQKMRIAQVFDAVKQNSDEVDAALTANTVAATAGAVSDGASAADIKDQVNNVTPMPEPGASGVDLPGGQQ